jgi:hypothetical protein
MQDKWSRPRPRPSFLYCILCSPLAHREPCRLRPDVSVVSADDCVLHHLGGHQLVVDVRLPRHDEHEQVAKGDEEEDELRN